MAENKTKATQASVAAYLAGITDETRRRDCEALAKLMAESTKQPATMWGTGIVGFGNHHYRYESGREGDICAVGFASRKGDISLYLTGLPALEKFLPTLGRHKVGKGCLYVRRLADVDLKVLEKMIAASWVAAKA